MAFGDNTTGGRVIKQGMNPMKVTLGGAVVVGDLLTLGTTSVQADGNNSLYAEVIAGESGASGAEITVYRMAIVSNYTTAGTVGATLYLSNTAGGYAVAAGTVSQVVGILIGATEGLICPSDVPMLRAEQITLANIEDVTAAYIIVGNASARPTAVAVSGDIAITNAGVVSISAGVIVEADLAADAVTQAKLDTTIIRMSLSFFQDGKSATTVLAANEHPKMRLKSGYAQLIEVADATGTTFTVKVNNLTDTQDMSDTLTFTQGTEAVGDVKAFTPDGTYHTADKADAIQITTAGTTTTLGEVVVTLDFLGVD